MTKNPNYMEYRILSFNKAFDNTNCGIDRCIQDLLNQTKPILCEEKLKPTWSPYIEGSLLIKLTKMPIAVLEYVSVDKIV